MKNVTLVALALSFALAACSDSNIGTVSLALTARQAAAPAPSAAFSSTSAAPSVTATGDSTLITLGNDSIIIRSAQVVLRKVELKRSDVASCDAVAGNDDCEEFETGATLVTLPGWYLNAAKTTLVDPASANQGSANQSVVANNIQNSFKAFEDDNHDGLEG